MKKPSKAARGNYVSEWFGHRVFPNVVAGKKSLKEQQAESCPFLTAAIGEVRTCIKSSAARGVCTINTATSGTRMDWLVCPYRALDPSLLESAVRRLFGFRESQAVYIIPAIRLEAEKIREEIGQRLRSGDRVFIYFDEKLGGELSIPATAKSPEFSFDVTIIEIELSDGRPHVGRFGVIEIQTMDFHGSYRKAVANLKDALRLHPKDFATSLQTNQNWLSEDIEGPNIANVFKRTFYQMMFKFQLGQNPRCAGCVLAVPLSVWESWQRHLGQPELRSEPDGTFSLFPSGGARPPIVPAWIYVFDISSMSRTSPSPLVISKIIATDATSISHYALQVAPAAALENIASATGMLTLLARRISRLWPELGTTLTV